MTRSPPRPDGGPDEEALLRELGRGGVARRGGVPRLERDRRTGRPPPGRRGPRRRRRPRPRRRPVGAAPARSTCRSWTATSWRSAATRCAARAASASCTARPSAWRNSTGICRAAATVEEVRQAACPSRSSPLAVSRRERRPSRRRSASGRPWIICDSRAGGGGDATTGCCAPGSDRAGRNLPGATSWAPPSTPAGPDGAAQLHAAGRLAVPPRRPRRSATATGSACARDSTAPSRCTNPWAYQLLYESLFTSITSLRTLTCSSRRWNPCWLADAFPVSGRGETAATPPRADLQQPPPCPCRRPARRNPARRTGGSRGSRSE